MGKKGLTDLRIAARLNVMTEGREGKLDIDPLKTAVNWLDAQIPIQITSY